MKTDRELLELAAKGAGMILELHPNRRVIPNYMFTFNNKNWNPLADDGDALRLAVKVGITIDMVDQSAYIRIKAGSILIEEYWGGDHDPCYRHAIVRAAAAIAA